MHPAILLLHLAEVFNPPCFCWQVWEGSLTAPKPAHLRRGQWADRAEPPSDGERGVSELWAVFHHLWTWSHPEDRHCNLARLISRVFSDNQTSRGRFRNAQYQQRGRDEVNFTALSSSTLSANTRNFIFLNSEVGFQELLTVLRVDEAISIKSSISV